MEKPVEQAKRGDGCCADPYGNDAVRLILGDAWHPGGLDMTGRLANKLRLGPGDCVVDLACGIGTTARYIATNLGCTVIGVDHSFQTVGEATQRSPVNGVGFAVGESNYIPLADGTIDAVIMECVLSSFSDKRRAIAEATRVLKSGGKLGVSDVVISGEIPEALRSPHLQAFCVSDALSANGYRELLRDSGLENIIYEDAHEEAIEFVEVLKKKIFVAQLLVGVGRQLPISSDQLGEASRLLSMAKRSIQENALGYGLFVARKRRVIVPMARGELVITVYRITGRQLFFKVAGSVCEECDLAVAAANRVAHEFKADGIRIRVDVRPWLNDVVRALSRGACHPPAVLVNGKLVSQGFVPTVEGLKVAVLKAIAERKSSKMASDEIGGKPEPSPGNRRRCDAQLFSVEAGDGMYE